jgi:hypothetical protein
MDLVLGKNKATVLALKGELRHLLPVVIVGFSFPAAIAFTWLEVNTLLF